MRFLTCAFTLALLVTPAAGQSIATADIRRIDSVFAAYDRTTSPGCALGIYQNGAITYTRGYGMANLEHGIAISARTVFDIGSTSKQFAATAVVLLQQDGKLNLDDEVRTYIPELPAYQRPLTIRHMLNHTSGLRDYLTLMGLHGTDFDGVTGDQDALDLIVRQQALNFEPGAEFLYSNSGFFLLSQIVKRVSGKTLAQFAHERIFAPLGMHDTHFHDDHRMIVAQRATGYSPSTTGFAIDMSLFEQTGDGAVYTTIEDLIKWDGNFYTPTVGGERLLRDLHTRGKLNNDSTIAYALGLFVDEHRGLRRVRHGGSWAGYRAELLRFPEAKTAVATLCNLGTINPSALADAVAAIVLRDRLGPATAAAAAPALAAAAPRPTLPAPPPLTAAQATAYVGTYYAAEVDATYQVEADTNGVTMRIGRGVNERLPRSGEDTFGVPRGLSITFARDARGRVTRFAIDAGRVRGIVATRVATTPR
ncbi:MAG: beta-lactamase family protein [Gemmatimonadetes bacterium]|nr:beta-lactamase family protein [Gemmatimonadota bacterium]